MAPTANAWYVQCGMGQNVYRYGPFFNWPVANLWLESHAPTGLDGSLCDENVSKMHHTITPLRSPLNGISKRATVDVEHALTGR